jgi:DNA-binding IclR family transcriptional regulator
MMTGHPSPLPYDDGHLLPLPYDFSCYMTKLSVLMIFAQAHGFLTPDQVGRQLPSAPDRRSLYSYLARLRGQGLLERNPNSRRGSLSYRLTQRGAERITYFEAQKR